MSGVVRQFQSKDIAKARTLLRTAIAEAGAAWVPADAVFDALMMELIERAMSRGDLARVAAHLSQIASRSGEPPTNLH